MAFKTMRLQLRFLLPLMLTLAAAAYVSQPLMDRVMLRWFSRDLNIRAMLVADTLSESMAQALRAGQAHRVKPLLDRVVKDERLLAVALCDAEGRHLQVTAQFPRVELRAGPDHRQQQRSQPGTGRWPGACGHLPRHG